MFRSLSTAVLLLLFALPGVALAQNTGKLSGRVTDADTGDPLIGANVYLADIQRGAATDIDGNYTILGIPVGQYDIQYSYTGYQSELITGVELSQGRTRVVDVELSSESLGEVVVEYERPLIQADAIGVPKVVTGEDIQNLPVRGVEGVASIQAGVVSNDGSGTLNIRGGRGEEVTYYIDGVKVIGGAAGRAVPQQAIAEQEMLIGTIPPQYGDATAGIISISTRSGGNDFFGSLEAITSTGLDSFGYNLGALTLGGPIVKDFASFFVSVQGTYSEDDSPYALETLQLNDDVYNAIQQSPQVVRVDRAGFGDAAPTGTLFTDDDFYYVGIPASVDPSIDFDPNDPDATLAFTDEELAEALGIDAGLIAGSPFLAYDLFTADDVDSRFFSRSGKDDPATQIATSGNLEFRPVTGVNLRVGGAYTYNEDRGFSFDRSLFNRDRFSTTEDEVARGYVSLRQVLSNTAFYQIQAEYSNRFQQNYPDEFGSDMSDLLFYGDIDAEQNAVARRYYNYNAGTGTYTPTYSDGAISPVGANQGIGFSAPGTPLTGYSKFSQDQFRVFGSAQTQVGVHELSFGGEYETQTQRSWSIGGAFARDLAECYDDGSVELACIDTDGDGNNDAGVTSYEQLPFSIGFDNPRARVRYYGYNYLGLEEVDTDDVDAYTSNQSRNVAPYKPLYYGGYVRDRIEYRDLVLDLGLRLDVFDNNTRVLRDPFALVDIYRVDDVLSGVQGINPINNLPSNIEGDYAVYVSGQNVVGYRDLNGNFYNTQGGAVTADRILSTAGGSPAIDETSGGQLTVDAFRDYEPQLTVMPRIGVTFPVTNRALFFASYNVTSQRPSENAFASIQDFAYASESGGTLNNADLKPETTTQYELGFRQSVLDRAALTVSGFYRTQRNKITLRTFNQAFPSGYTAYTNQDFSTTKGVEFAFDLRRTRNLQVNANYTLQFAEGTGSDAQSANLLSFRTTTFIFPETLSPLAYDQRHNVNVSVDYRLGQGEGPMIGGVRPFAGFGLNVLGVFKSGNRYTQLDEGAFTSDYAQNIGLQITGEPNEVVIPATTRLDLKLDRGFNLGGANLRGYLWIQNLLDTDNVVGVYRTTGNPDTDGYLSTDPDVIANLGSQIQRDAYRFLYSEYVGGPVTPGGYKTSGGSFYSPPRRIRLGVTLDF
ncbi:TonB-dependent receptor domain-containing protein [Rubrivirga marina]|uniref:TonB-dependent receptor domain-containing protein n=1 Tax=Rubrivirga marina TaxID=1196024 RepID=UPI000BA8F995|nr:TonB-dependent receptor [Rubrivirga marina]